MYLNILKILTLKTGFWFPVTLPSSYPSVFFLTTDSFHKPDT
jgi:hypothetical protein